jgi:hypothetical protein
MNSQREPDRLQLDRLLADLRDGPVLLSDQLETEALRSRLLPRLRERVRVIPARRQKERRLKRVAAALLVSASALSAAVFWSPEPAENQSALVLEPRSTSGVYRHLGAGVSKPGVAEPSPLDAPLQIVAEGELSVSQPASLRTARGVQVDLGQSTRVGLDALQGPSQSTLKLVEGSVHCNVPPLGKEHTFSVRTSDTEVIVHGTRFTVAVQGEQRSTCVRVSEGLVEVRHPKGRSMLSAGQSHGCDSVEPAPVVDEASAKQPEPARTEEPRAAIARGTRSVARAPASKDGASLEARGTLAQETQLLSEALSAERKGEQSAARQLYARILREYPGSPLAPEARRGLSRVE